MISPFDLFKEQPDGSTKWLGPAANIETGKAKAREMMISFPGVYFVYSQTTGNKFYIKSDSDAIR